MTDQPNNATPSNSFAEQFAQGFASATGKKPEVSGNAPQSTATFGESLRNFPRWIVAVISVLVGVGVALALVLNSDHTAPASRVISKGASIFTDAANRVDRSVNRLDTLISRIETLERKVGEQEQATSAIDKRVTSLEVDVKASKDAIEKLRGVSVPRAPVAPSVPKAAPVIQPATKASSQGSFFPWIKD